MKDKEEEDSFGQGTLLDCDTDLIPERKGEEKQNWSRKASGRSNSNSRTNTAHQGRPTLDRNGHALVLLLPKAQSLRGGCSRV